MGIRDRAVDWLASNMKSGGGIWGSNWTSFMGTGNDGGSGMQEYGNTKGDYSRSFVADGWVYRCVDLRGSAIAQVPLKVYAMSAGGKRQAVDHDALGLLQQTNDVGWVAGQKLWRATLASLDLFGHYAWQLDLGPNKIPKGIYFFPPASYTPIGDDSGFFAGIKMDSSDKKVIPRSQLVYDATMSLSDPVGGTSKISAARMALNLRSYSLQSNLWFFRNNQRPDWLLTMDSLPTEENVARMRRYIQQWSGGDNKRGPLILGGAGGMRAQLLTQTAKDAEWVAQQRLSQEEVAAIFAVPVMMLNNLDRATLSNFAQARTQFWHDGMRPELDDLADSITRLFLWRWPDAAKAKLRFGWDYTEVEGLAEDINKVWERALMALDRVDKQVSNGVLIPNQARKVSANLMEQLGLDSTPWLGNVPQGNDRLVPYTVVPSQQTSIQAIADVLAARGQAGLYVVENVPGAPHIGDNARLGLMQAQAMLDRRLATGTNAGDGAASPPKPPALPSPGGTGGKAEEPEDLTPPVIAPEEIERLVKARVDELVA